MDATVHADVPHVKVNVDVNYMDFKYLGRFNSNLGTLG